MENLSPMDKLHSLSQTSPTNDITSTVTTPPASDTHQRTRKYSKYDAERRQHRVAAIQAAKREVLTNVKEDWIWPPAADHPKVRFPRRRKSTEWRERQSDTSPRPSRSPSPSSTDPYKFESPDAVAPESSTPRTKRRKLVEDELSWNEGLRTFIERRDFWTGAETRSIPSNHDEEPSSGAILATEPRISDESRLSVPQQPHLLDTNSSTTLHTHDSDLSSPTSLSTHARLERRRGMAAEKQSSGWWGRGTREEGEFKGEDEGLED
ncbi:MAG: hypothetical protein Q9166_000203 [cf. Caloplaca sp. 2 TL-2023]